MDTANKTGISLADLTNGTIYGWKVRYKDDIGAWSAYSAETQFTTVALPTAQGSGLTASYAKYRVRTNLPTTVVFTGVDPTVDFDWKTGKPNRATPANNFFVRWEGSVLPQYSEAYLFRVVADGGVRLWVNNVLVIDDWVRPPFAIYRNSPARSGRRSCADQAQILRHPRQGLRQAPLVQREPACADRPAIPSLSR
ncbi:MAG: PA14 domain-containing protein [Pseudomonas sp.]